MPILLAPLVGIVAGMLFSWFAREELAQTDRGPFASPALLLVACYGLLVLAPIAAYFLAVAPDWSVAYLAPFEQLPPTLPMAALLVTAGSPLLGFALCAGAASRRRSAPLIRGSVSVLVTVVVILSLFGQRWAKDATFAQFHGDFGIRSLAGGELGHAVLWMNAVLIFGTAWMWFALRRLTRRARR